MLTAIKKRIAGLIERLTSRNGGEVISAAGPSVVTKKALGGRPRKYADNAERKRAYRKRKKRDEIGFVPRDETSIGGTKPRDETSYSTFDFKKIDDADDGGDARARAADRIATEIEQMIKDDGHWPRGGWAHAVVVEQVRQRLKLGQRPA